MAITPRLAHIVFMTRRYEDMIARYQRGAPEAELLKRPDGATSPLPTEHGLS